MSNKEFIKDIYYTLTDAKLSYENWWVFKTEHPDSAKVVSVYNQYSEFFGAAQRAMFANFVIKLASLFDANNGKHKVINLKSLEGIERNPHFSSLWERGREFHKYRSKQFAHRDEEVIYRDWVDDSGCRTYDSLKQLLDDTCQIFDDYASEINSECLSITSNGEDLRKMIRDIYSSRICVELPQ